MRTRILGPLMAAALVASACGGTGPSQTAPPTSGGSVTAPPATAGGGGTATPGGTASGETPGKTTPPPTDGVTPTPATTASSITYALDGDISYLSNAASDLPTANATQFLYNGLYTYDESLTPVPDIAAELATIKDGVWTVKLRDNVYFHNGDKLTADDVVATYRMLKSPNCRFAPDPCAAGQYIQKIEKLDDLTVAFTIDGAPDDPETEEVESPGLQGYAPFATVVLPSVFIDSRKVVEAAFAKFEQQAQSVSAAEVKALGDRITAEEEKPTGPPAEGSTDATVNYEQFRAETEALLTKAAVPLPEKDVFPDDDTGAYLTQVVTVFKDLAATTAAGEADKIAAAYTLLDFNQKPVGTGPFKLEAFRPGQDLSYVRHDQYHHGAPKVSAMYLPIIKEDVAAAAAIKARQVDWKFSLTAQAYAALKDDPDLKFAEYPDFGYYYLGFNMHDGQIFTDRNLRQAVSYCFDKPATVKAATNETGVPAYADIPPASWAYNPDVNRFEKDVAKSTSLIESSGWTRGGDGIYEKDGKKLSFKVLVRAGKEDRIKFMSLMAEQVRECGIDFQVQEADFQTVLIPMLTTFPPIPPGDSKPFDAYFGSWSTGYDPDPYSLFHSDQCSTKDLPDSNNFVCWRNPEADKLIEQGLVELDQAKRAAIYKEFERIIAEDQPYVFAWSDIERQAIRTSIKLAEGEEDLTSPVWYWRIHQLTNDRPD